MEEELKENKDAKEQQIIEIIERIRPYLQRDGGDIQFISLVEGIVYVSMIGACAGCFMVNDDIKFGVEAMLMEEVEGIKEVRVMDGFF